MVIINGDINDIQKIPGLKKSIVVVGNFDGIHTHHEKLLRKAQELAIKNDLQLVLVSFDRSWRTLFNQEDDRILKKEEKIEIMDGFFAIDYYIELEVNENLKSYQPKQFMEWMKKTLKCQMVAEGSDFTFGTNSKGTVKELKEFFGDDNVYVMRRKNLTTSSTKIRKLIADGKVDKANKLLYSPFKIYFATEGKRSREIIYPNIKIKEGYYQAKLNDKVNAVLRIDNKAAILISKTGEIEEPVIYAILEKKISKPTK
ncbi:hypothetical protein [Mesoplasma lactucae]|uniref:FAD synthase n=1 Tax=Mesoplasma lactucae ATCC 49193 TaxID=81460 RepID=A0A291IRY6_9MOLU|nr:hypothetical protein [Mesoplasma lactucae]ATG97451.1 hypothetical protein CP520_01610 [Mesoplasma lactucae ATCC 49193]ATZ20094.1 bifunctional riboflavin kinase/FMN adenylyltransferase [Mesoplasma lactucae ATCC 49193]MCL8216842.1 hypothetical protein [Mesoplasma lactucae ATCC 49193]